MDGAPPSTFDLEPVGDPRRSNRGRLAIGLLAVVLVAGLLAVAVVRRPAGDGHTGYATGRPLAELVPADHTGLVVAQADGTVVLRLVDIDPAVGGAGGSDGPTGSVPESAPTTAPTTAPTEVVDQQLFAAPEGHVVLDLAVDPGGEHLLVTTVAPGSCVPQLQRIDVVSGSIQELGPGFAPAATGAITTWLEPAPDTACEVGGGPLSRRTGLTVAAVAVEAPEGRQQLPPPWPSPLPPTAALHPLVPSPDGSRLAVVREGLDVHDRSAVAAGAGEWPPGQLASAGRTVAWVDGTVVAACLTDRIGVDRWVQDGARGTVSVRLRTVDTGFDGQVVALDASSSAVPASPEAVAEATTVLAVSATGDLVVVGPADQVGHRATGVVDAALVRPALPDGPVPTPDTAVDGTTVDTAPGTSVPETTTTVAAPVERRRRAPMGGNRNVLGWPGELDGEPDGFFLAIDGPCTSKEQGDRYASGVGPGVGAGQPARCVSGGNPEHRPGGYSFVVEVPEGHGAIDLVIADPEGPSRSRDSTAAGPDATGRPVPFREMRWCSGCPAPTTTVVVRAPDGAELARQVFGPKPSSTDGGRPDPAPSPRTGRLPLERRVRLASIGTDAPAGDYRIEVATDEGSDGTNAFGLAAFPSGTTTVCDAAHDEACPRIYAAQGLSIGVAVPQQSNAANLPLAELSDSSDVLVVELWDPGEGAASLEVLRPDGSPASFTWEVVGETAPGAPTTELPIGSEPYDQRFNGKLLRLDVAVADGVAVGQWTVRYTSFDEVTDRTTWDVFLER